MKNIIIITTIIMILLLAGCGKNNEVQPDSLDEILKAEKVPFTSITEEGNIVKVTYEASSADEYDDQIVADWGMIFGASADPAFQYKNVMIINTINSIPTAIINVSTANIKRYINGTINESEFWNRVDYRAVR